jgi:hypothetical protein
MQHPPTRFSSDLAASFRANRESTGHYKFMILVRFSDLTYLCVLTYLSDLSYLSDLTRLLWPPVPQIGCQSTPSHRTSHYGIGRIEEKRTIA